MLINQTPLVFSILLPSIFPVLTIVYTEIKPGQYPYLMFFDASILLSGVNVTGVGILVSDRTILTDGITGKAVKLKPTFAYSGYSGKSNNTNLSLRYSIQEVLEDKDYGPAYDVERRPYVLNHDLTLVILKDPVKFEDGLHPIKIPYYTAAVETELVHVGLSMATGNLYHSKIRMKKWEICIKNYQSVNHLAPPRFFWPSTKRTMVCTSVMPNVNNSMPPDSMVQGPFIEKGLTPKDDRLVGIHSFFYYLKNETRIAIGPDVVLLKSHIVASSKATLT